MSQVSKNAWDAAQEADYATSIPIDVAKAAIHHSRGRSDPALERIVTIAPHDLRSLNEDEEYVVYKIRDTGAVMYHERGPLSMPIGRVQEVVDHVVRETDYIVTNVSNEEYYSLDPDEDTGDDE